MPKSSTTSAPPARRQRGKRPSTLLDNPTQLLAWQGLSLTAPLDWNLASFSGDFDRGHVRIDDVDGPRLELRWEQPKGNVDLDKSIARFLDQMARQAQKRREKFAIAARPIVLDAARFEKGPVVSFGWTGEMGPALAGQGWGASWLCEECGRVVVAHVLGRGREKPDKVRRTAKDIISTIDCHGHGGWQTWSVFGLQLDIPEDLRLGHAKLMTGRLELEWTRPVPPAPRAWVTTPERIAVTRVTAANVVLEGRTLEQYARYDAVRTEKKMSFDAGEEAAVHGHDAWQMRGAPRDLRLRFKRRLLDLVQRRRTPRPTLRVWHCPDSNKLYSLTCALGHGNEHVGEDVLDSLECHGNANLS